MRSRTDEMISMFRRDVEEIVRQAGRSRQPIARYFGPGKSYWGTGIPLGMDAAGRIAVRFAWIGPRESHGTRLFRLVPSSTTAELKRAA